MEAILWEISVLLKIFYNKKIIAFIAQSMKNNQKVMFLLVQSSPHTAVS